MSEQPSGLLLQLKCALDAPRECIFRPRNDSPCTVAAGPTAARSWARWTYLRTPGSRHGGLTGAWTTSFNTCLVAYEAAWRSFPDAEPRLEALGRVAQIAVLSNGNQEQQEGKVSQTGPGGYIGVVQTSGHLGVAKPDPRAFELAFVRLGVRARAAVSAGDQLEVDALAATAAG